MELKASDKQGFNPEDKPRIKKGYYTGILKEFKPRIDKDGKPVESKFGRQAILVFQVYQDKEQIVFNGTPVELGLVMYTEYKDPKTGNYYSAISKDSKSTKILKALGWSWAIGKALNTDELIGRQCELNIDDYEREIEVDGGKKTIKISTIKDVAPLETGDNPLDPLIELRCKEIKNMFDNGMITEDGYKLAINQLKNNR